MIKEELFKIYKSDKAKIVFFLITVIAIMSSIDSIINSGFGDKFYGNAHPAYISILGDKHLVSVELIIYWFMPIFLIFGYCEKYVIEKKKGISNIYLTKISRNKLFWSKIITSFLFPYIICLIPLLLNLLLNIIFLQGGTEFGGLEDYTLDELGKFAYNCLQHPYATYFGYLFSFLLVCGLLGIFCQNVCMIFNDNKIAYVICIALWDASFSSPITSPNDAMQAFEPEFSIKSGLISIAIVFSFTFVTTIINYALTAVKKDEL